MSNLRLCFIFANVWLLAACLSNSGYCWQVAKLFWIVWLIWIFKRWLYGTLCKDDAVVEQQFCKYIKDEKDK